jgi:phage/conjugal plasmid C-4 type zinc finger TraR family protein
MADIGDVALRDSEVYGGAALANQLSGGRKEAPEYRGARRICRDCKKPIPEKRLNAYPDAVRCVKCQAEHDPRRPSQG